jgi:hypothetical protein
MRTKLILIFVFLGILIAGCSGGKSVEPSGVEMARVQVYFMDENRFADGTEPYEVAVAREIHPDAFIPRLALQAYFDGPTPEEYQQGLRVVKSNCTGFSDFYIEDEVAHVFLTGPCTSGGSTYTIANPVMLTLKQFPEIRFVKLYDAEGQTGTPEGLSDSIPFSLEP